MDNLSRPAGILLVLVALALAGAIVYAARPNEPTVVEPIRIRVPETERGSSEKGQAGKRKKAQRPPRQASPAPAPAPAPAPVPPDDRDDDDGEDGDDDDGEDGDDD